jgi:hypothetical protein
MSLKKGKSKKIIQENINELLNYNNGNKKIGKTKKSLTKKQKIKQAIAIAYSTAGKRKKKK